MYKSFYSLKEKPFNLLPDPDYLFMSRGHDNAYTHLEYAIAENKGFVVITGEIGSGKTTLINFFLRKIQQDIQVGLINNTYAPTIQFMKMICQEFELEVQGMDKAEMHDVFYNYLLRQFAARKRVVLIIDEAQNLSAKAMEEVRMLSNLEAEKHHLIQMILVGQPELKYKLQRNDLEQFAQRVTVHCHLDALGKEETDEYIRYRLKVGGAKDIHMFDKAAVSAIYDYTQGIPRLINILCDTALVYGYADALRVIDGQTVQNVIKAREAGGIFGNPPQMGQLPRSAASKETTISLPLEKRLGSMESKILMLENSVFEIDLKLNILADKKNERDTIVLELFKMLKDSMEKRWNTLVKFSQFRKKMSLDHTWDAHSEIRQRSSLFSRLKMKKENTHK